MGKGSRNLPHGRHRKEFTSSLDDGLAAAWCSFDERDIPKAIEYTRMMLDPSQQQLPEEMANALESAVAAWESRTIKSVPTIIEEAAEIAIEKGFL